MKKDITNLSRHLFWDVNTSNLTFEKNKSLIIKRVLDYGLLKDWNIIRDYYGIDEIAECVKTIRDLDKKSANFIATLSNTSREKFICYTMKQSTQKHWNF